MKMYQLRSYEEFTQFQKSTAHEYATHLQDIEVFKPKKPKIPIVPGLTLALRQQAMNKEQFYISGYSYPAKKNVDFICDFFFSPEYWKMNWRVRKMYSSSHTVV
jgi:hypothetical protein